MAKAQQAKTIYIGVDFGTTYSGVALVFGGTPKDIEVIKTWPGVTSTADKCPTLLLYDDEANNEDDNDTSVDPDDILSPSDDLNAVPGSYSDGLKRRTFGALKDITWGYQVRLTAGRPIRCIKLFLDSNQRLPTWVDGLETMAELDRYGRHAKDAVADYLAQIQNHISAHLTMRYTAGFVKTLQMQYVLTVPAVWSDVAKNATIAAAKHAGMGPRIAMVSEPEAAAYYVLRSTTSQQFKTGDRLVVCDAGGGTVDLISYCITSMKPYSLKECAVGTGDVCGATNLDIRFENHIRGRMGPEAFDQLKYHKEKTWQVALRYVEEEPKRRLGVNDQAAFEVPFPGVDDDAEAGIKAGFLTLTAAQMRSIYDPVVARIQELVSEQLSKVQEGGHSVTAILLVGGFGQSRYLFECLKRRFGRVTPTKATTGTKRPFDSVSSNNNYKPIAVIQPPEGWTAVAQGAALRGLDGNLVSERRCRYNYGTTIDPVYDPHEHDPRDCYFDTDEEILRTNDVMQWYLKKGDKVTENRATSIDMLQTFPGHEFPRPHELVIGSKLYYNEDATPPKVLREGRLRDVCVFFCNLTNVPRCYFTRWDTPSGASFWAVNYQLNMVVESATIRFFLTIGGQEYGSVTAQYEG